ncbi:MAG: YifB family Mg chelatase-like AAA ATPase [Burkholderiales bacterium]
MSLAVLHSRALVGADAPPVSVEVHLGNGLPSFTIVGLPEAEVKESRERVRAALSNCRFDFPARRITVNLAPAELPKESGRFDLPIAIGILAASGQIPDKRLAEYEFAGELSLTGDLRPVRGALAMTYRAKNSGRAFILPAQSAPEAALVAEAEVFRADSLHAVCAHLTGECLLTRHREALVSSEVKFPDLAEVKGQAHAKRALEIAAAGGHSLLMIGPPGTGKSMLAARLPGLLPAMSEAEALESAAMQSLGAKGFQPGNWMRRPYRAPHHTASAVALVGGGANPRPGEISLAHHGVLFLDELPEFDRKVLEVLREPMESGRVAISRAARQVEFPARFQFVAAMNPCHCGYLGHHSGRCRCTPDQILRYRGKISGPLQDRIDIQIEVPALPPEHYEQVADGETSAVVLSRTTLAREHMLARQEIENARLATQEVDRFCMPSADGLVLLRRAVSRLGLSARGYHRILKVARTIADLALQADISVDHIAEAIQYRRVDRT